MIGEQCFDINECDDLVWQGTDSLRFFMLHSSSAVVRITELIQCHRNSNDPLQKQTIQEVGHLHVGKTVVARIPLGRFFAHVILDGLLIS